MSEDLEQQERLAFYGYLIQWAGLVFTPMLLVSLIYTFTVRIAHDEIRSHLRWQRATCLILVAMILAFLALLAIGMAGVNSDHPASIAAVFLASGLAFVALPYVLYRMIKGSVRLKQQLPMESMLL